MRGIAGWGCLAASLAFAQPSQVQLTRVAGGFRQPTHIAGAGDGSGRLFVVEQAGRIRILKNGAALAAPFLDITARVGCCGERGLLSVAFPPDYIHKQYFYVYYTATSGDVTVSRFRVTSDPNVADAASETVLLTIDHRAFANHNGGQLAFGPNGYLYIGTGDGGGAGDTLGNGQNTNSLLGKLLRIDVESSTAPYAIPPSNPFAGRSGFRPEIWDYGLRNPWRFSFDRLTGDLYIADVGQNTYEEIDFESASESGGRNYGWNRMEGLHCYQAGCNPAGLTLPIAEYSHSSGDCSITGGFLYRGARYPGLGGWYFYADYCTGRLWALERAGSSSRTYELMSTGMNISSFGEDEAGEVYLAEGGGTIYQLTGSPLAVVNAASGEPGVVAGSIASLFATGLSVVPGVLTPDKSPLPREINGTAVLVNGTPAPLFAVVNANGGQQINFQVPLEAASGSTAAISVTTSGTQVAAVDAPVLPAQPGIFTSDGVRAAALHGADYALLTAANPARGGEYVILYATGLGAVDNPPPTGMVASASPLSRTTTEPQVTVGGLNASLLFSGLAPGFAGLFQLNVLLPAGVPSGDQDVIVTLAGQPSKPAKISVQ